MTAPSAPETAPTETVPATGRRRAWGVRRRWVVVAVVAVVVALVGWQLSRPAAHPATPATVAPQVAGPTAGGGHYSLATERGHWVLVNFFASWCTDCKAELAQLTTLQHRHPVGLRVVSVDGLDDSFAKADRLIREGGGSWPLVNDPAALSAYRVTSLPQSFLVNPDGQVTRHVFGGVTAKGLTASLTHPQGSNPPG